jgi:hypothetical protein
MKAQMAPMMQMMRAKMGKKRFGAMVQTMGPMMSQMTQGGVGGLGGGLGGGIPGVAGGVPGGVGGIPGKRSRWWDSWRRDSGWNSQWSQCQRHQW